MISFENTEIAFKSKTDSELRKADWLFTLIGNPVLVSVGKTLTDIALKIGFPIRPFVKPTIFSQFVGGETISECDGTIQDLSKYHIGTILDYSVEGKTGDAGFEETCEEIIRTIKRASGDKNIPFSVFKTTGVGTMQLLEKISAGEELSKEENSAYQKVKERVNRICKAGHEAKVPVFIDAEESWIQDAIDSIAEEMMGLYNREWVCVYNTTQMYRHDRLAYIKTLHTKAKANGYRIGLKIVRGAYMEKERSRAAEKGYPSPIQPNKEATDRDYNLALEYCISNIADISICAGTHNEHSSMFLAELLDKAGIPHEDCRVWFSQLLGMSDHISYNIADAGYNACKYVPYGPVREVMPYLIRRAQENTSVKGQTGRELSLIRKEIKRRHLR
jgi:proline dehydrogenase